VVKIPHLERFIIPQVYRCGMQNKNIMKQDCCVLTPRQWYLMREHLNAKYQIICDCLINTGMRVEEFWELVDHPHWYSASRRCIDLPKTAIKKSRCTIKERTILLTPEGCNAIETMIAANGSIKYTDRSNMRKSLIKAAIDSGMQSDGIMPKTFRKSLVSWFCAAIPEKDLYFCESIGHSREIRAKHYMGMGFERRDVEDMRKFLRGWGE
jgi:hypothetical protein